MLTSQEHLCVCLHASRLGDINKRNMQLGNLRQANDYKRPGYITRRLRVQRMLLVLGTTGRTVRTAIAEVQLVPDYGNSFHLRHKTISLTRTHLI
jgi:hypothetical protein